MGKIREILESVWVILTFKWYWIIVGVALLVLLVPLVCLMLFLVLPSPFNALSLLGIIIAWGIAAGYKDWILLKIKEEKRKARVLLEREQERLT